MTSFGVKVIRGLFRFSEHLAPGLAGRAAFELFCRTPDPTKLGERERRAVDAAADFMAEARKHRLKTKSGAIAVHEFRPFDRKPLGTVLAIHGWRSRTEHLRALVAGFRDAGYRVVSVDLPGHGRSSGRRLNMALAVEAAHAASEWFGPFEAIVGHSFGGAVAVNAAVGSIAGVAPVATRRLVLIAAPDSMPALFEEFGRHVHLGPRAQAALGAQVERVAGRPLEEFVGSRQLAALPLPTLVIHAPDDREVPADNARMYAAAGDHVRLLWVDGLGHRRILVDPAVAEAAVRFVAEQRMPARQAESTMELARPAA
jgi:pimeloyl-ACP methyl ester carboxylesterase